MENFILLGDRVANNKVDNFINCIIKKLDPIAIAVKNDEIGSFGSGKANKTDEILVKSKNIKYLSKAKNLQKPDISNNLLF